MFYQLIWLCDSVGLDLLEVFNAMLLPASRFYEKEHHHFPFNQKVQKDDEELEGFHTKCEL